MPSIFELDETLSKTHTFREYCLDEAEELVNQYELGKTIGLTNIKNGVNAFFKHDEQNLCGIATSHNNPAFVAGNIASILHKDLNLIETNYSQTKPVIAINQYKIAGLDNPFYISYLPQVGDEFQEARRELGNNNRQIHFLRQTWIDKQLIQRTATIDVYQSDFKNHLAAQNLNYVNGHDVAHSFDFKIDGNFKAADTKLDPIKAAEFDEQLTTIRKKALLLRKNGHKTAATAADQLYSSLSKGFDAVYFGTMQLEEFQDNCNQAIEEAHSELDKHRGWKDVYANIALFFCTLGLGFVAKGIYNVCNNKPFMFFTKTDSAQILDNYNESVASITPVV